MSKVASVLSVYSGRCCLGHITVRHTDGESSYAATLPNGRKLDMYPKQAAAREAIEAAVASNAEDE